jgi:hypothetical protein
MAWQIPEQFDRLRFFDANSGKAVIAIVCVQLWTLFNMRFLEIWALKLFFRKLLINMTQ